MSDHSDRSRGYSEGYAAGLRAAATIAEGLIGANVISQSRDAALRVFVKGVLGAADSIDAKNKPSAGGIPRGRE